MRYYSRLLVLRGAALKYANLIKTWERAFCDPALKYANVINKCIYFHPNSGPD